MKPRILIFTDSLGLPREMPEVVNHNETWVALLEEKFQVVSLSFGGATIKQLYSQIAYLKLCNPDFIIVQSGIVDCVPRALGLLELEIVKKSKILTSFLKRKNVVKFLREKRKISYTSAEEFRQIVKGFKKNFDDKLYWVGIIPANQSYEQQLLGVTNKINDYNKIIEHLLMDNFINTSSFDSSFIMTDGIHLNRDGNKKLVQIIIDKLLI